MIEFFGYRLSVYSWIVRLVLYEKGMKAAWIECNPFEPANGEASTPHPFGRVPVLRHGGFMIFETGAITRYIDGVVSDPPPQPQETRSQARCDQILSIVDAYVYWPLVRQVFSHGVYRPAVGEEIDEAIYAEGLADAPKVLAVLEEIAVEEGSFLLGSTVALADLHLAPMMDCFSRDANGAALLKAYPRLTRWWAGMREREAMTATRPGFG